MIIDVVIPFILGPRDSIELRYALRSIAKNLRGDIRIWLYGDKPDWVTGVEHIAVKRIPKPKYAKFYDQLLKIELACRNEDIGYNFLYTYDDVYFMKPVTVGCIKQPRALADYSKVDNWFSSTDAGANWVSCMKHTLLTLRDEQLPMYNYETHLPRIYNRIKGLALLEKYNSRENAFQFATMYFNNYDVNTPELLSDNKYFRLGIYRPVGYSELLDSARERLIMNVATAYDDSLRVLDSFFGEKCCFER